MKHTISVLVENHPGVLAKVAGLFARRGFNIDSLAVGTTENPKISRMTIVVCGDDTVLEQIQKQLYKLVDVLKVFDLPAEKAVDRELLLIKVAADAKNRAEITELINIFHGKIADVSEETVTIELAGDATQVDGAIKMLEKFGIKEMVRTGKVALLRGAELK